MTSRLMSDTVFEVKWLGPSPCDSWPGRWSIMEMRLKTGRDKNGALEEREGETEGNTLEKIDQLRKQA